MNKDFQIKVNQVVAKIPKGQVRTYKQVAYLAGYPTAWRAVGNIMKKNYDLNIPCHRVIRSDGKPGGYNRDTAKKIRLLLAEGVKFLPKNGGRVILIER